MGHGYVSLSIGCGPLNFIREVHPDFDGVGVASRRLHENREAGKGVVVCVGMIWHKSDSISGIESDRICGIIIRESEGTDSFLTVIGVYLPHLNKWGWLSCWVISMLIWDCWQVLKDKRTPTLKGFLWWRS